MRELRFIRVELIDHNHEDYWALSLQSKFHVSKASVPFTVSPQWKYFFKETNTEKNVRRTEVCAEHGGWLQSGCTLRAHSSSLHPMYAAASLWHLTVVPQAHSWRAQQTDMLILEFAVPTSTASAAWQLLSETQASAALAFLSLPSL